MISQSSTGRGEGNNKSRSDFFINIFQMMVRRYCLPIFFRVLLDESLHLLRGRVRGNIWQTISGGTLRKQSPTQKKRKEESFAVVSMIVFQVLGWRSPWDEHDGGSRELPPESHSRNFRGGQQT